MTEASAPPSVVHGPQAEEPDLGGAILENAPKVDET